VGGRRRSGRCRRWAAERRAECEQGGRAGRAGGRVGRQGAGEAGGLTYSGAHKSASRRASNDIRPAQTFSTTNA
jgi:hypothetical protein